MSHDVERFLLPDRRALITVPCQENAMALSLRRVVTGHDEDGRAVVIIDETCKAASLRDGVSGSVVWSTEGFPVDNSGNADTAQRRVATSESNGTVFRVIEYG